MKNLLYFLFIFMFLFCKREEEKPDVAKDIKEVLEVEIAKKEVEIEEDVILECTKVYEIQSSKSSVECKDEEGKNEKASGLKLCEVIVTAPKFSAAKNLDGYYVQDKDECGEYKGMMVVVGKDKNTDFKVGDVLLLEGNYIEYYCLTELEATSYEVKENIKKIEPCIVNSEDFANPEFAEKYEGGFVKIENVEVIDANPDAPKDYGCFVVTGGLNVCNDYKLSYMNKETDQRKVGDKFEYIIGVIKFSFDKYRLMPRFEEDMKLKEEVIADEAKEDIVDVFEIEEEITEDVKDIFEAKEEVSKDKKKTIYEIQSSETSKNCVNGGNIVIEKDLEFEDVVVSAGKFYVSPNLDGYYVLQPTIGGTVTAPFHGIMIVINKELNTNFTEGDILSLKGNYKEFYCLSEIEVKEYEISEFKANLPQPSKVSTSIFCNPSGEAESWEGVLIKVENVELTDAKPDAKPKTPEIDDWGCFKVDNCLMVCNNYKLTYMNKETDQRKLGDKFTSITGVLKYDWGLYKLMPRKNADMIKSQ